jgi:hypothetical protein
MLAKKVPAALEGTTLFKIGMDLKIAFVLALSISIAAGMQILFMTHIPQNDNQADYLIDSYFYMHLGETVARESDALHKSIYALSEEYKPNAESQGIVFLNACLYRLLPSWYCLPVFFGLIYFSLFYFLYRLHLFHSTLFLFPFYTLYLHIFLPSKETFLLIGFILLLASVIKGRYWYVGVLGLILMLLSRPSVAAIFAISFLVWLCSRKRVGRYILILAVIALYFIVLRRAVFAYSLREQMVGQYTDLTGEVIFCRVGPFSVCYGSLKTFEIVLAQRILTLALLPLKWIWNALQLFNQDYGELFVISLYHRTSAVFHTALATFVLISRREASHSGARIRSLIFSFAAIYIGIFGAVIYYQPTRQVLLVSCFVLLSMSLTGTNGDGVSSSSNSALAPSTPRSIS